MVEEKRHSKFDYNGIEEDGIITLNNEFYTDDFYDYKDTFINHNDLKLNGHRKYIETGEEYDEDVDENNDFMTGPLAIKKSKNNTGDFIEANKIYFDDGNEFDEGSNPEIEDMMMMDTFFKRVDSMELVKPKKAKIVSNYLMGELLGDGSYGKVKECMDIRNLCRRAVKIINLKMVQRKIPRGIENVRKEICIMKKLNHKNIIKLYDTFEKGSLNPSQTPKKLNPNQLTNNELLDTTAAMVNIEKPPKLYIFMDYCMTSLEKMLKNAPSKRLFNYQANYYFKQLIDGLEYLHSLNVIHNDIKPGNLLVTCDDTLKICDFSISAQLNIFYENEYSKEFDKRSTSSNDRYFNDNDDINPNLLGGSTNTNRFPIIQCTPMFQCPEMLAENIDELSILKNASKIDVWSSGITLYQLTTGDLPFQGQTLHQIFENIRSTHYEIKMPEFIDKNLSNLLRNMMNRDPLERWSLNQIRNCEWFKKKHPLVKDELVPLPDDVKQNELATFRMINYLEKLYQPEDDKQPQQLPQTEVDTEFYSMENNLYSENGDNNTNNNSTKQNYDQTSIITPNSTKSNQNTIQNTNGNSNHSNNINNIGSNQNNKNQLKQYGQATKVKRSNCILM